MKVITTWLEGTKFTATADGHSASMDAKKPIGSETAMTPKELVVAGLCGCAGVDVAAHLKKNKIFPKKLTIQAEVKSSKGQTPSVFTDALLKFEAEGDFESSYLEEAVRLSQTLYCGVSAMLSKTVKISYQVFLNGKLIGEGKAQFN